MTREQSRKAAEVCGLCKWRDIEYRRRGLELGNL